MQGPTTCAAGSTSDADASAQDDGVQKPKRGRRKNMQLPLEPAESARMSAQEGGSADHSKASSSSSTTTTRARSSSSSSKGGATLAVAGVSAGEAPRSKKPVGMHLQSLPGVTEDGRERDEDDDDDEEEDEDDEAGAAWPPLVGCIGEAVREFVPTVRVSSKNKMHAHAYSTWKGHQWSPPEFVRAPGGPPSNVAISLSRLGGRVAFLGKVGEDALGQELVREMNVNGVQTRGVRFDKGSPGLRTAVTRLKLVKRYNHNDNNNNNNYNEEEEEGAGVAAGGGGGGGGGGRWGVEYTEASAGSMLQPHDIDPHLLQEVQILHFGATSVLPGGSMRATLENVLLRAKQHGTLLFFDPNFPAPLWHSPAHTWAAIRSAWLHSHVIEVTKHELEFLLGENTYTQIKAGRKSSYYATVEELNKDRDEYHYDPTELEPLWHSDLRLLLVTDGTFRIHFYTPTFHGSVKGGEDVLLCPLTCDRSGSGDAIVAGVLRKLSTIPKLWEDQERLERSLRFAICAGVIAQWTIGAVRGFPTERAAQNLTENLYPPWMIDSR